MLKQRSMYIGQLEVVTSPSDPDITFGIKHIGTRELIAYRDRNAVVRYTTRNGENGDEYVTEKDYPAGTGQIDTIMLCLAKWDLADEKGEQLPITPDTIRDYLSPQEVDFLFSKCHEFNPILLGGTEETKKD